MEADISTQAVGLASSADFSLINLFIRADVIVKSVIILLIACSIYSWAVIIEKFRLFKKINQSSEEFETKFWNSRSAESFYNNLPANVDDPMALVFKDAMQSLLKKRSKADLNNRITTMLETSIEKQISKISKGFHFFSYSWFYSTIYRIIWNSLGDNEFFSINSYFKKYKFSDCSSRYSRGFICNSIRFTRSNTSCYRL